MNDSLTLAGEDGRAVPLYTRGIRFEGTTVEVENMGTVEASTRAV